MTPSPWEIVCPDGNVRHWPYSNQGDAAFDAGVYSSHRCQLEPEPNPLQAAHGPCPEGEHGIRQAPGDPHR